MAKTTLNWDDIKNPVNPAVKKSEKEEKRYSKYADIVAASGLKRALYSVYQSTRDNEFWIKFSNNYTGKSYRNPERNEEYLLPSTHVARDESGESEDSGSASSGALFNFEDLSQSSESSSSSSDYDDEDDDSSSIISSDLQELHRAVDRIGEDDLPEDENEETSEDILDVNPEITPNQLERYEESPKIILEGSGSASMNVSYKSRDEDSEISSQISEETANQASEVAESLAGSEASSASSASAFGDTNRSLSSGESEQEKLIFEASKSSPTPSEQNTPSIKNTFLGKIEKISEKLDSISDNFNEQINYALDEISDKLYELSEKSDEDKSSFIGGLIKSKGRKLSKKLAIKLKDFVENKKESDEKEKEIREEKKQKKENLKEEKKHFKEKKKQYDEYRGSELIKEIIENDLQGFQESGGLFDPEVLKLVISDLKILSKKGPCPELFERLIKKFSYLSSTYNPREEPLELIKLDLNEESKSEELPPLILSEDANEYLMDKYGFINAAESELKLICATLWNSIGSNKNHAMGKNNNYKATIAFCGSIMREEGNKNNKNSCRYEYEIKRKMIHEYMLKKQAIDDSGYNSSLDSSSDYTEKNNMALARTFAIILANEKFSSINDTGKPSPATDGAPTQPAQNILEELQSKYCKNWYDFKNKNPNVRQKDFKDAIEKAIGKLKKNYIMPESLKQMKTLLEDLDVKKESNLKNKLLVPVLSKISSRENDIPSNKDDIIKSMFEDPCYFDISNKGENYIKKPSNP